MPIREYTNKILDLVEEGMYGKVDDSAIRLLTDILYYMPEDNVKAFWYEYGCAAAIETEENEND